MFIPKNDRTIEIGERVRVYRNLHNGMFSIKKNGLVVGYAKTVMLVNVRLIVGKGQQRAVKEGKRNVHAYADGIYIGQRNLLDGDNCKVITYNPFRLPYFHYEHNEEPINRVSRTYLADGKIYVV